MSKKSQIFMFDLIFSFVVIILTLSLVFNYYIDVNLNVDIHELNKNILSGFTHTKINTLNDEEIRDIFKQGKIKNIYNTIAQQVSEFYYYNDDLYAKNLSRIFVEDYIRKEMNFNITLENKTGSIFVLYEQINRPEISITDSSIVSRTSRTIFGFNNATDFYGPYTFKIEIWM